MLTASRTKEVSEGQRGRIVEMHKARKGLKNVSKSLDVYQLSDGKTGTASLPWSGRSCNTNTRDLKIYLEHAEHGRRNNATCGKSTEHAEHGRRNNAACGKSTRACGCFTEDRSNQSLEENTKQYFKNKVC